MARAYLNAYPFRLKLGCVIFAEYVMRWKFRIFQKIAESSPSEETEKNMLADAECF